MKLYPEMFLSPWHLIVLAMALVAWAGLKIGGYDRRTVLRSTGLSALAFYFILTIPVGLFTQDSLYKKETMLTSLDESFAERKASGLFGAADYVIVHVGAYRNEDGADIIVYAGNYHDSEAFKGDITVHLYDKNDEEVFTETYENVTILPGDKKKLDTTYTSRPMETYRFRYEKQP